MTYELARQLNDAGFPQSDERICKGEYLKDEYYLEPDVYAPTLSELIEACADKFLMLQRNPMGSWTAAGGKFHGTNYSCQHQGESAEETLAKLWLSLHSRA